MNVVMQQIPKGRHRGPHYRAIVVRPEHSREPRVVYEPVAQTNKHVRMNDDVSVDEDDNVAGRFRSPIVARLAGAGERRFLDDDDLLGWLLSAINRIEACA